MFPTSRLPRFVFAAVFSFRRAAALIALTLLASACLDSGGGSTSTAPERSLDLSTIAPAAAGVLRLHGSEGLGSFGVPVTGGHDVDGDGDHDTRWPPCWRTRTCA